MYICFATPNFGGPQEEGPVSSQGSSQLDKIDEEYLEDTKNNNLDNDENSYTITKKDLNKEIANDKTEGPETNKKEMLAKEGNDYFLHHVIKKIIKKKIKKKIKN